MQQGDVIIGVGSTLLDSTMPCVCPANHKRCVPRGVILFLFIRYDACLGLIKSACKKADEDFDDPYIVRFANLHRFIVCPISVLFPFGLFFTGPHGLSSSRQSSVCPHREFRRCRKKQQQRSLHLIRRPVRVSQQCRRYQVTDVCRYTTMQKLETQFSQSLSVARCYQDMTTPVVPGFIPAGAMLPLPRCCAAANIHK